MNSTKEKQGRLLSSDHNETIEKPSRRRLLKSGVAASTAIVAGSVAVSSAPALATDFSAFDVDRSLDNDFRVTRAAELKINAAVQHFNETIALDDQLDNNDERRYKDDRYYSSFTKCLPCNSFGEVRPGAFRKLKKAMRSGRRQDFANVPLALSQGRRLENPQGAFRFEVSGLDSHATRIKPAFKFRGAQGAAEVAEVYWQALTRDVAFIDYESSAEIDAAVADINGFAKPAGALDGTGQITAERLFRGQTQGDLNGPFISQFLLRDFSFGPTEVQQRYKTPVAGSAFMTDLGNWLHIQKGGVPLQTVDFEPNRKYIYNNRALAEFVHGDALFQAYLYAALQILELPGGAAKFDSGNPYFNGSISNQTAFGCLGGPHILESVTRVANMSLTGAWFQKWRVHRFLRPEAYGARVHFNMTGQRSYEVHSDILNSHVVQQVFSRYGSYLCPQAYPEGSPTHPAYPAGHATVAGACVTVLKAFFNESFIIDNPVQADATGDSLLAYVGPSLTLGGELNKLASNVAIGRDAAGVHYRQDGIQGLEAGEQQAIAYLQDQSRAINESDFDGFTLTKFDGSTVKIKQGVVTAM